MTLVASDVNDTRELAWGASSNKGYYAYTWYNYKLGGPYATWDELETANPNNNFNTSSRCSICGGPTPCTRND